jgi:hypothetical protein
LEEKLEVDSAVFGPLLRDELRICGNAVENLFIMGARYALSFYHPDNYELEESPQNGWLANPQQKTKFLSLLPHLCNQSSDA